jgi:hypothetical protein
MPSRLPPRVYLPDQRQRKEANPFLSSGVKHCCMNEIRGRAEGLAVESASPVHSTSAVADYPYRGSRAPTHCARLKTRVVVTSATRMCDDLGAFGLRSFQIRGPDLRPSGACGVFDHITVDSYPDDQSYSAIVRP